MLGVAGGAERQSGQAPLKSTEGPVLSVGSGLLEGLEAGEGAEWWVARGKLGQLEYKYKTVINICISSDPSLAPKTQKPAKNMLGLYY